MSTSFIPFIMYVFYDCITREANTNSFSINRIGMYLRYSGPLFTKRLDV